MDTLESVLVHITGSDVPLTPKPLPSRRRTSLFTRTTDDVTLDGAVLLLADTPNRTHASIIVSGATAGDSVVLAGTFGEAQAGNGAIVPVGANVVIESTDSVWLGIGTVTTTVSVGVIAEFTE